MLVERIVGCNHMVCGTRGCNTFVQTFFLVEFSDPNSSIFFLSLSVSFAMAAAASISLLATYASLGVY